MDATTDERQGIASGPEDAFVNLFAEVFGFERVQMLVHEYPFIDIHGGGRFIDYALQTTDEKIAFEIDGLMWHLPDAISVDKFEDDLLRQNSLIHQGWRVFRWSDREVAAKPERIKVELELFLERVSGFVTFDDFLPRQLGEILELRPHQDEALASLARMRTEGKTIALLEHAQGLGKTIAALSDAKRMGGRMLYVVHTRNLVQQTCEAFLEYWPEVSTGLYLGSSRDPDSHNVIGTIQSVSSHLDDFHPNCFDYIVIDEAHHATGKTYQRLLAYFRPKFVLGLTATPDRADNQSILDVFRESAHRLSLEDAIALGELVPIRCLRVLTNIELSTVRFNQVQYNRRDLEDSIVVPARDRLIVDTYLEHIPGRKAVVFCVNVRHAEALAELFRKSGVAAESVSGRMPNVERDSHLAAFHRGMIKVLCACDILNEGWDCPDLEALLMARPTLSRVIYLQQLGRGTRKSAGKESLIVFDFVDNALRYNQPLSLHRAVNKHKYRPGAFVLAPEAIRRAEEEALANGEIPVTILEIGLWAKDYQEIDLFNWQDVRADMLTVAEAERELAVTEGLVRRAIERGDVVPDHSHPVGDRTYHYFNRESITHVREVLGVPEVGDHNIKDLFQQFVGDMHMSASYKPVLLLAILNASDENGRAKLTDAVQNFRKFYEERRANGLVVEAAHIRLSRIEAIDDSELRQTMLSMPFRKFEQRLYLKYERDLAYVRFQHALWRQLTPADLDEVRAICSRRIAEYYERIAQD